MEVKRLKVGLVGTSWISEKMAQALHMCPNTVPKGIYSRSPEKAKAFATRHRIQYPCSTLEELAEVCDAVYIASPNSLHCRQSVFFLERGIPVLCEKPMGSNEKEILQMLTASERGNALLMEAHKSKYMPAYRTVRELLPEIGQVRNVYFNFSKYSSRYDAHLRGEDVNTFKGEFSNGALLDMGVYCLYPALDWFGIPLSVTAASVPVPGGVDGVTTAVLTYPGFLVTINTSKVSEGDKRCEIQGEKGTLVIDAISSPRVIEIRLNNGEFRAYSPDTEDNDMVYECQVFAEKVFSGESSEGEGVLEAFRILDRIRSRIGLVYPAD